MIQAQHKTILASLICFLALFPFDSMAKWNSFVVTFDKNVYGKGRQTWQIASYDEHWTYFANQNGLLQFDGNV